MKSTCQLSVVSCQLSFCALYFALGTLMWSQSIAEILKTPFGLDIEVQSTKYKAQKGTTTSNN